MQAIARWGAFLNQIRERHAQVLTETDAALTPVLQQLAGGGDTAPMSQQLTAALARLQELESRVEDTWHQKVEATFADENIATAVRDAEFDKGRALRHQLSLNRELYEPQIWDRLARAQYAHAQATQPPLICSGCRNALSLPLVARAFTFSCPQCRTAIAYDPSALMKQMSALGAHSCAQVAAANEWRAMRDAAAALGRQRPPHTLDLIVNYERSQVNYWRSYWGTRSQFEPERGNVAAEVTASMYQWYTNFAEFETAWVAAGRPKTAP